MTRCALQAVRQGSPPSTALELAALNRAWQQLKPTQRVECAFDHLPANHVLSSSFGMQAAVMLHLVTQVQPDIPVIFVDTGYHFAETYGFVDQLTDRLRLNLEIVRADLSPAWQEARFGRRWEQGRAGIDAYNQANKVEPMRSALRRLKAGSWFSGLRRTQASTRAGTEFIENQWQSLKIHPIADWTDRDIHRYLARHDLPYHPLREKGYLSIGDWHTTRSIHEVDNEAQLRFLGETRECGLHQGHQ
ncbi:MAG: phosphoadenylyl-sulfate reductase [Wenzhouxiangellaceae bacterium]|nr:phosphoadenylyl-sulfate reductase [Wenzhouxiangellaceae bacterium]